MASNKSGFDNEDIIKNALNNKRFEELNENLKELIKYSFENYNGIINCEKQAGQNKSDLKIQIGNEIHTYSIKNSGSAHSVHQEPVENFITFLEKNFKIEEEIKNDLRFFIWGDGTFDGSAPKKDRLKVNVLKKENPKKIERLKNFFNPIEEDLFKRFCFEGADCSTYICEYIYFGNDNEGVCCKSSSILNWIKGKRARGVLPISRLTMQAWNRALNDNPDLEERRGVIQLKWGTMKEDLQKARR